MDDAEAIAESLVNANQETLATNQSERISLTNCLSDNALFIDNELFLMLINDVGCPNIDAKTGKKCMRKPQKTHHKKADDRMHRNTWKLGHDLYQAHRCRTDIIARFDDNSTSNPSRDIERACKWLLGNQSSVGISDANAASHLGICQCKEKLLASGVADSTAYALSQKVILCNTYQQRGAQTISNKEPAPNSSMRSFGIALLQEYRDDLNLLTDNRAASRQALDSCSSDKRVTCEKLGLLMCNKDVVKTHPPGWLEAMLPKNNNPNALCNQMRGDLNPNDKEDIDNSRSSKEIELMWKSIRDLHKGSMRKWRMKTGGGPGDPSNHSNFELRDLENFSRHNK